MAALRPLPGKPGKFFDRSTGKVVTLTEARETDRYDTVQRASGSMTAGTALNFFRTIENKNELDSNIPEAGKLVTGSERMIVERVGFGIMPAVSTLVTTSADYKRIMTATYLSMSLNKFVFVDGPAEMFPSGYGLTGQTTDNAASVMNLGVPSTAAQSKFVEQQVVTDAHTIKATATFQARTWLTTSTQPTLDNQNALRLYIHGILESAATNN